MHASTRTPQLAGAVRCFGGVSSLSRACCFCFLLSLTGVETGVSSAAGFCLFCGVLLAVGLPPGDFSAIELVGFWGDPTVLLPSPPSTFIDPFL